VYNAISKLEIIRSDKELLTQLAIKKPKMSIVQLQKYLVDKDKDKAEKRGCEQFETEVFKWKPLRR